MNKVSFVILVMGVLGTGKVFGQQWGDGKDPDIPESFQDSLRLDEEIHTFGDLKNDAPMPVYKPDSVTRYYLRNKQPNPNIRFYLRNHGNAKGIREH